MKRDAYPHWICADCGNKHGRAGTGVSTWHLDTCGWCLAVDVPCTEPRDYGYPEFHGIPPNTTFATVYDVLKHTGK